MRHDMQEVLITPGRHGSKWCKNTELRRIRHKRVEEDEVGWKEGMVPRDTKGWHGRKIDRKGDHVMPLKHWLEAQVGRRWDDVYSEIRKNNSPDNAVGAHIYTHLWGFVERNPTYQEDGTPCHQFQYNWRRDPSPLRAGEMYIDRTGILRKAKGVPKPVDNKPVTVKQITSNTYAVMNKRGVWFILKYSNRMKTERCTTEVFDHWEKTETGGSKAVNRTIEYDYCSPYHTEVYLKRDDFSVLPRCHPPNPYTHGSYYYDPRRIDKGKQHWYLVEYKTMSKKDKQKLGLA